MGLYSLISNKINHYQSSIKVNLFGEWDGFKMFGSTPSIMVFFISALIIFGYIGYLFNEMFALAKESYQTVLFPNDFDDDEFNDIYLHE